MFKLNTRRTYKYPVTVVVFDEEGKEIKGKFYAIFKVLPKGERKKMQEEDPEDMSNRVVAGIEGLEIIGEDGTPLKGQDLVDAALNDPACDTAIANAYLESIIKKNQARN